MAQGPSIPQRFMRSKGAIVLWIMILVASCSRPEVLHGFILMGYESAFGRVDPSLVDGVSDWQQRNELLSNIDPGAFRGLEGRFIVGRVTGLEMTMYGHSKRWSWWHVIRMIDVRFEVNVQNYGNAPLVSLPATASLSEYTDPRAADLLEEIGLVGLFSDAEKREIYDRVPVRKAFVYFPAAVHLAYLGFFVLLLILSCAARRAWKLRKKRLAGFLCRVCEYDTRGVTGRVCPECGTMFPPREG